MKKNLKKYGLYVGEIVLLYVFSLLCCKLSLKSPLYELSTMDVQKLRGSMLFLNVLCYYLCPCIFYMIFQEFHWDKKSRMAALHREKPKLSALFADAFRSVDFWKYGAPLLALLTLFDNGYLDPIVFSPFRSLWILRFLNKALLYALPMVPALLLSESLLRRDWHRQWKASGLAYTETGFASILPVAKWKLPVNVCCVFLAVFLLPAVTIYFTAAVAFVLLLGMSRKLIFALLFLAFLVWLWRLFRVVRSRKKLKRELKKVCAERGYSLTWRGAPFRGVFTGSRKVDLVVETPKKVFVGALVPIYGVVPLYVQNDSYRYAIRFLAWHLPFPKHRFGFSGYEPGKGKEVQKVAVFSREPNRIRLGKPGASDEIFCGDRTGEVLLQSGESFCHWLDRLHLMK